ncbi:MAG: reverse transcriptase domain-containing protein [Patescibacteria group bacterium]|nr:reverse transcriptase domain-containing protein [Patescibacteria group bacterium]
MKILHDNLFSQIISIDNLFCSWNEFKKGKRKKKDVQEFELHLEDNLFNLHEELKSKTYKHSHYTSFFINDPKRRHIHKATVKDRIVHHAIYRILYPIFDKTFIHDSYSCRNEKGTHKAVDRLQSFLRRDTPWRVSTGEVKYYRVIIKLDIKKFFASVDHEILFDLIKKKIKDENVLWLVKETIDSFNTKQNERERESTGIPLGNLTSQLFANIYLNELDQFVKHRLKVKSYARYCDDFVILYSVGNSHGCSLQDAVGDFIKDNLKLQLHPDKTIIRKPNQGIDFLGYVVFPYHKILRTKTKKRMFKKLRAKKRLLDQKVISQESFEQIRQSYFGVLKHCEGWKLTKELSDLIDKKGRSS